MSTPASSKQPSRPSSQSAASSSSRVLPQRKGSASNIRKFSPRTTEPPKASKDTAEAPKADDAQAILTDEEQTEFINMLRSFSQDFVQRIGEMSKHTSSSNSSKGRNPFLQTDEDEPHTIDAKLIAKRCLPNGEENLKKLSMDELAEQVLNVTQLELDRLRIQKLENLECYTKVTHGYFQHNEIEEINDSFLFMADLWFLTLADNYITKVENLRHLDKLEFLDLSDNDIEYFEVEQLPKHLRVVNIKNNPCCDTEEKYQELRNKIIKYLPRIEMLDDIELSEEEQLLVPKKEDNLNQFDDSSDDDTDSDISDTEEPLRKTVLTHRETSEPETNSDDEDEILRPETASKFDQMRASLDSARAMRSSIIEESADKSEKDLEKEYESIMQGEAEHQVVYEQLDLARKMLQLQHEQQLLNEIEAMQGMFNAKKDELILQSKLRRQQQLAEREARRQELLAEIARAEQAEAEQEKVMMRSLDSIAKNAS